MGVFSEIDVVVSQLSKDREDPDFRAFNHHSTESILDFLGQEDNETLYSLGLEPRVVALISKRRQETAKVKKSIQYTKKRTNH